MTLPQSWIKFSKPTEYKDTAEESCKENDEMNGNETLRIPLKMSEDAERKKRKNSKYHEDVKNSDNQDLLLAHLLKLKDEETEYQIAS